MRAHGREAKLADAQFAVAGRYGFSSWRSLKAHVDRLGQSGSAASSLPTDETVASFLRAVGDGRLWDVEVALAAEPRLVNAIGPHPYWGGRPQALHVSIETKRRDMFDLLVASGADINGANDHYEHWSPLMLTFHWDQPNMRQILMEHDARVGLVEAMLFEDDAVVEKMLRRGESALPNIQPNGGSLLAFARTPFAIDRLMELGVSLDRKDRSLFPIIQNVRTHSTISPVWQRARPDKHRPLALLDCAFLMSAAPGRLMDPIPSFVGIKRRVLEPAQARFEDCT